MSDRRFAVLVSALGAGVFVLCCALVRGGLFDSAPYGDVYLYARYSHEMTQGHWPYRDFFDEYPPLAQPLFLLVRALPGTFAPAFKWTTPFSRDLPQLKARSSQTSANSAFVCSTLAR